MINQANRRVLGIELDDSLPGAPVVRVLEQLGGVYGLPKVPRVDNRLEFRLTALTE